MTTAHSLYRPHELVFRTQYAELKERANAAGTLLAGSPGGIFKRDGTGHEYWYRVYYPVPKKQAEQLVGSVANEAAYRAMLDRIEFAAWMNQQVVNLRKLQFQVSDKGVASVLVELHNRQLFAAGLVLVGTLAYVSWLNEYGAITAAARTQDIDIARGRYLKLATPLSFLESLKATHLPFTSIPGMPSTQPPTSIKLPGREGLRIDLLAPGALIGETIEVPELEWHAQTIPHYDYLLRETREAAVLAGGHCIPVVLPSAERMIWHKLYASTHRIHSPAKAQKDLVQAATLAALVVELDGTVLQDSFAAAPADLQKAALARMSELESLLTAHPQVRHALAQLR
ncbi:MAG: GSU2403 family nucleotidyltransferase fold protein [Pseudomonadota bacterium]|nr:GSU2403 family nucleotidyltransferase fold protein [Pseudomonadota bacterium]